MLSSAIQRHPFIRLLLPLMVGITLGYYFPVSSLPWILGILGCGWVILIVGFVLLKKMPTIFGVSLNLCLIACGYSLCSWHLAETNFLFTGQSQPCLAIVKASPQEKPRTYLLESDVYTSTESPHRFLLYVAKDSASATIRRGDTLSVYARLQAPSNDAMTDGFDYVRYLKRKGITGTAYVSAKNWKYKGHSDASSWIQRLQNFRIKVVERYQELGFEGDELAVLTALTTGQKEDLSDELRETYSIAGVSHVLALSGLHIGLIYGFLLLLLMPVWKRFPSSKPLTILFIIAILWMFAVFTGLSTSVVRSVTMFSIHAIAMFREERPATLHVLALTAFAMLLFKPLWLFDVGFQLSFTAVAAIIILQPRLDAILPRPSQWLTRRFKDLLTVSVAAQIGTAPLVILYFHRFSTHFLLSNLLVLPLVTFIMYGAFLLLLLTPIPTFQQWVADGVNLLINSLNKLLHGLTQLPIASIDHLGTNVLEIFLFYLCVYLFLRYLTLHTASRAISTLFSVWLLVSCHFLNAIIG